MRMRRWGSSSGSGGGGSGSGPVCHCKTQWMFTGEKEAPVSEVFADLRHEVLWGPGRKMRMAFRRGLDS